VQQCRPLTAALHCAVLTLAATAATTAAWEDILSANVSLTHSKHKRFLYVDV